MSSLQCPTCKKTFTRNYNLERHLARKFPCKQAMVVESQSITKNHKESQSITKNHNALLENNQEGENTPTLPTNSTNTVTCIYCSKTLCNSRILPRHYRNTCDLIPEAKRRFYIDKHNTNKKHINNNKQLQVINNTNNNNNCNNKIQNINNTNTNSNNTNNIQNNITIKLNAFGKEDISSLEKKDILKLIDQAYKMIPSTMKAIHFNIPENRNMFIPNVNRPLVKVFNGEEWVFKSLENVTKIVSDNIRDNIESWTNRYDKKLSATKRKALNAFVAQCIEGKMQLLFKDELKMFLMTYSQKLKDYVNEEITNNLEDLQIENIVETNIVETNI